MDRHPSALQHHTISSILPETDRGILNAQVNRTLTRLTKFVRRTNRKVVLRLSGIICIFEQPNIACPRINRKQISVVSFQ